MGCLPKPDHFKKAPLASSTRNFADLNIRPGRKSPLSSSSVDRHFPAAGCQARIFRGITLPYKEAKDSQNLSRW